MLPNVSRDLCVICLSLQRNSVQLPDPLWCHPLLTVQCRRKKSEPCGMARGSATTDDRFAYFTPGGSSSVFQYECSTEKWEELPSCPYHNSGLVIIDRKLTAVGGEKRSGCTNKLLSLRKRKWVEICPPMNTACSAPAVVRTSDGECLAVIGGYDGHLTAAAQLFNIKGRKWYKLTDLPQPLPNPSATIVCDDLVYVVGDDANGYSCSIFKLYHPATNHSQGHTSSYCGQLSLLYQWYIERLLLSVDSWYWLVVCEIGHQSIPYTS